MKHATPIRRAAAAAALAAICVPGGVGQEPAQHAGRPAYVARREPFKVEVTVPGLFEAAQMTEIALGPETWTDLIVETAAEQGARVEAGDTILQLDTRAIDKAIRDLEMELALGELTLRQTGLELEAVNATLPLDLEAAERAQRHAAEDLAYFLETGRAQSQRDAKFSVESAEHALEYELEELKQLEQMYEADELTEETEEIVLRRARHSVDAAEHRLKSMRIRAERTLEMELPREERGLQHTAKLQDLAWQKARHALPLDRERKQVEEERLRLARQDSEERLQWLRKDREALTVKAAGPGVIYYGDCQAGRWPNMEKMAQTLRKGGKLQPHQVVMTVVQPRPIHVRAEIPEKDLAAIRVGLHGKVQPAGFPERRIPARVDSVSRIPVGPGKFEALLSLGAEEIEELMPGMTCSVTFVPYFQVDAVLVPSSCIFTDPLDDEIRFVFVKVGECDHEKRPVVTGKTVGDRTEILGGLEAGEEILLQDPTLHN